MRPNDIIKHVRMVPFRPFRLFVSDGASYDVRHPEMILVTRTQIAIGLNGAAHDLPEEMAYCDPVHITRIEPIKGSGRRKPGRRTGR